jgi:hypothetical protein
MICVDNDLNIKWIHDYSGFDNNRSVASIKYGDSILLLNEVSYTRQNGFGQLALYVFNYDSVRQIARTINCFKNGLICSMSPQNIFLLDSNTLIISYTQVPTYAPEIELQTAGIVSYDLTTDEFNWHYKFKNDTTSHQNFIVFPGKDQSIVAAWNNRYYYPYKSPNGSQNVVHNLTPSNSFIRLSKDAEILEEWELKDREVGYFRFQNRTFRYHDLVKNDKDVILTGELLDTSTNSFIMCLDKDARFKWFRQFDFNYVKPLYDHHEEKLMFRSITRQENTGVYILAGEYRAPQSDSFPKGAQKGIIYTLDSNGCFEKGCRKTDHVESISTKNQSLIYPNPTSKSFKLDMDEDECVSLTIRNMLGKVVKRKERICFNEEVTLNNLTEGNYFVEVRNRDNIWIEKLLVIP